MTAKVNNHEAAATVEAAQITLTVAGESLTFDVSAVTSITDVLLAARKVAYGNVREDKAVEREAAKLARVEARKAKAEEAAKKATERIAKLQAELAALEAKAS